MRDRAFGAVLCLALAAAPAGHGEVIDRVLAVVNGHLITLSDVRASLELGLVQPPPGRDRLEGALDIWIDRVLVLQEVERFAPADPAEPAAGEALARVTARAGGQQAYEAVLARYGFDEDWVRQWVLADLRTESYIEQRFTGVTEPTAEELENYFRQHPDEFRRVDQALPAPEAQRLARERVMAIRRRAVVEDWIENLRRRAEITRPVVPTPIPSP